MNNYTWNRQQNDPDCFQIVSVTGKDLPKARAVAQLVKHLLHKLGAWVWSLEPTEKSLVCHDMPIIAAFGRQRQGDLQGLLVSQSSWAGDLQAQWRTSSRTNHMLEKDMVLISCFPIHMYTFAHASTQVYLQIHIHTYTHIHSLCMH